MLWALWPVATKSLCHLCQGALWLLAVPGNNLPWQGEQKGSGMGQQQGRTIACHPCNPHMLCHSTLRPSWLGSTWGTLRERSSLSCRKGMVATPIETFLEASAHTCRKTGPLHPPAPTSNQVSAMRWTQSPRCFPVLPAQPTAPEQRQETALSSCFLRSWKSRALSLETCRTIAALKLSCKGGAFLCCS